MSTLAVAVAGGIVVGSNRDEWDALWACVFGCVIGLMVRRVVVAEGKVCVGVTLWSEGCMYVNFGMP